MNYNQYVKPVEKEHILVSALRSCRKKTLKKTFTNDKVTDDEKSQFQNCIIKFLAISDPGYEGLREGFFA